MKKIIGLLVAFVLVVICISKEKIIAFDNSIPEKVDKAAYESVAQLNTLIANGYSEVIDKDYNNDFELIGAKLHYFDNKLIFDKDYEKLWKYTILNDSPEFQYALIINGKGCIFIYFQLIDDRVIRTVSGELAEDYIEARNNFIKLLGNDDITVFCINSNEFIMVGEKDGVQYVVPYETGAGIYKDYCCVDNLEKLPTSKDFLKVYRNVFKEYYQEVLISEANGGNGPWGTPHLYLTMGSWLDLE